MSEFIEISMGALAPKISTQLSGLGFCERKLEMIDKDADAITRLLIRGYMTPSQAEKARGKIVKEISKLKSE